MGGVPIPERAGYPFRSQGGVIQSVGDRPGFGDVVYEAWRNRRTLVRKVNLQQASIFFEILVAGSGRDRK